MTLGKDTFGLTKTQFNDKIGRIIKNFRASSRLIGEPREFVLRCCKLTDQWSKMANNPDVIVCLRNIEIAGGRKIKMISLELGSTRQPVPKAKLVNTLYPTKKIATTATPEEKHYNAVKIAMRGGIQYQLKTFRDCCELPVICSITGRKIRPGMKADVDHVGLTFSEIADSFLTSNEIKYTDITLKGPPTAKRFSDATLWVEWMNFHEERARYSLVCASANRSKGCEGYQTPVELIGTFAKEDPEDLSLDF
jgi:hypothetical protein